MILKLPYIAFFLYLFAESFMYKQLNRVVNRFRIRDNLLTKPFRIHSQRFSVSTPRETLNKNGNSIAATVFVDSRIRTYLKMKNNERKTRILLPAIIDDEFSIIGLRQKLESRLSSLFEQPYVLRVLVPELTVTPTLLNSDEELRTLLRSAQENQRLSIQLFVDVAPGQFPPPTEEYLTDLADPLESDTYTLLSFYNFANIRDAEHIANELRALWLPFSVVGRVYLATEGINAQCTVPTNVLSNFKQACETHWLLRGVALNTDHKITREEYLKNRPFKALHIRIRDQIVADGWSEPLDWHKSGYEMPPEEWHKELDNSKAVILDCRNSYESDVGRFDNAISLNTTFFHESWPVLDEILENVPKDAPVMTYCTGGIRCVKINAYIEQKLGFKNVSRLKGGIVSYARELATWDSGSFEAEVINPKLGEQIQDGVSDGSTQRGTDKMNSITQSSSLDPSSLWLAQSERRNISISKFRGMNYVFDERMGSPVTTDLLANCETCGSPSDQFINCQSDQCHIRFIQCDRCRSAYDSCCSKYCQLESKGELIQTSSNNNKNLMSRKLRTQSSPTSSESEDETNAISGTAIKSDTSTVSVARREEQARSLAVDAYCDKYSVSEPEHLSELRAHTESKYAGAEGALRMLCSQSQGRLLAFLTKMIRANHVLELGTFTGYSSLCFAEGIRDSVAVCESDGGVVTCDVDDEALKTAQEYIKKSPFNSMIDVRHEDGMQVMNSLISEGRVFDLVFLDADKRQYQRYVEHILESKLLRPGGLILVDNTLWKGLVLHDEESLASFAPAYSDYGKKERMQKIASAMHQFNVFLKSHAELRPLLLPLRDGLTIIEYIPS